MLVTLICPKCSAAAVEGTHFCPKCGASIDHALMASDTVAQCPRCRMDMDALVLGNATARECSNCAGLWLEAEVFDRICGDREQRSSVLGAAGLVEHKPNVQLPENVKYLRCPACTKLMNRVNFSKTSGVIIDVCRHHGAWLDGGELGRLIAFIDGGGVARSRAHEQERLVAEQQLLNVMRSNQGAPAPATSWHTSTRGDDDAGSPVLDVVHLLGGIINFIRR